MKLFLKHEWCGGIPLVPTQITTVTVKLMQSLQITYRKLTWQFGLRECMIALKPYVKGSLKSCASK